MSNDNKQPFFDSGNLLTFIFSKWKPLLVVAIIAMIASTILAYVLPVKYKATVALFATQNNNLSRAFLSEHADESKDFLALGDDNNAEQMLQILKSDDLMYALEKKFNLYKYYGIKDTAGKKYMLKADYDEMFLYDITEYQSLSIIVYDSDPAKAALMANSSARLADSLFQAIIRQRAVAAYLVVKRQHDSATAMANMLEDSMSFFRRLGILNWDFQVKELTTGYADAEVKGNAEAIKTISDELKSFGQYGKQFWIIANRLNANYEWVKQTNLSMMEAKVNAEQSIPSFYIADNAVPPDRRTYPVRGLVVAGGTIAALFFALLLLLIMNRFRTIKKN
jgi:Chain length determinant protein